MAETEQIIVRGVMTAKGVGAMDYESLVNKPVIDDTLQEKSTNAVQNAAVTTAINNVSTAVSNVSTKVDTVKNELINGSTTVNNSTNLNGQPASYYAALNTQGISTYTHSRSGNVHNFVGSGNNGKAKMTANVYAGDTFAVNGQSVSAYCGPESAIDAMAGEAYSGKWVTFVFDGAQLNFKGGGGLSNTKLAQATATANDVLSGKTFYSKANGKNINTGNIQSMGGNTVTLDANTTGYTFATQGKYCTGNMNVVTNTKGAESRTVSPQPNTVTTGTFETAGKLCTGNMTVTASSAPSWPMRTYTTSKVNGTVTNKIEYLTLSDGDGTYLLYVVGASNAHSGVVGNENHVAYFQGTKIFENSRVNGVWAVGPFTKTVTSTNREIKYSWNGTGQMCFYYCRIS